MRLTGLTTILLAAALAALPATAAAGDTPAPIAAIPPADLATVAARGAQLYAFDQAAWHTTDTMIAAKLPADSMTAIRGWTVEPLGAVLKVTYYGLADGAPFAIYSADFADGKVSGEHVWQAREDRRLSPLGRRIAAARVIVLSQTFPLCVAKPFNPVALPPDAHGVLPVYLLTPMVEDGVYPMGGHHEVDVAMDGTIVGQRDFTKSCLPMRDPGGKEKTVGLYVTHVLDAHPTELHVYLSLWAGIPVYVLTGTTVWEVAGTRIHLVQTTK